MKILIILTVTFFTSSMSMAADVSGSKTYESQCSACHGKSGEGIYSVFPSLLSTNITSGPQEALVDIIMNGKSGTAMVPSGDRLDTSTLTSLISYVRVEFGKSHVDNKQLIASIKQHKQNIELSKKTRVLTVRSKAPAVRLVKDIPFWDDVFWDISKNDLISELASKNMKLSELESYILNLNDSWKISQQALDVKFIFNSHYNLSQISASSQYPSKSLAAKAFNDIISSISSKFEESTKGHSEKNSDFHTQRRIWKTKDTIVTATVITYNNENVSKLSLVFNKRMKKEDNSSFSYSSLEEGKIMIGEWGMQPYFAILRSNDDIKFIENSSQYVHFPNNTSPKLLHTIWEEDLEQLYTDEKILKAKMRSHKKHLGVYSFVGSASGCSLKLYTAAENRDNLKEIEKLKKLNTAADNLFYDSCSGALYDTAGRAIKTGAKATNLNILKHSIKSTFVEFSIN